VEPALSTPLTPNLTINIIRSLPVVLEVDGRAIQTRTHYTTVAEVLNAAGVKLLALDYALPALTDSPPADGSPIRVVRVSEQFVTETAALPYETQYQANADLEIDNTQVVQAGAYGTAATRIRVRYENGIEVSRTLEDTWTAIAPQPRLISYGTKIVIRTVDTADGPIEYWRAVRMYATSYSASRSGTPRTAPWYGRTRSGKTLTIGMAAIDLRVMPLGTRLYVPGYGYVTAEDTGGGVKGKMIDLGYDDWNFVNWHQYVTVYFLTPVPPADQIKWTIP
jgi:3D (Asp-Asp-Asp) domain-containing protein